MKAKKTSWSFEVKKKQKMLLCLEKKHIKGGKSQKIIRFREQQSLLWPISTKWTERHCYISKSR